MGNGAAPAFKTRLALGGGAAIILLAPLLAMGLTDEVTWTAFDFAAAALVLGAAAAAWEAAARLFRGLAARSVAGLLILLAAASVWAHGAVGVF